MLGALLPACFQARATPRSQWQTTDDHYELCTHTLIKGACAAQSNEACLSAAQIHAYALRKELHALAALVNAPVAAHF